MLNLGGRGLIVSAAAIVFCLLAFLAYLRRKRAADGKGMLAARLELRPDGRILLRGGNGQAEAGRFAEGEPLTLVLEADCAGQRVRAVVNGSACPPQPLMCPTRTLERLVLRTKRPSFSPTAEDDLRGLCPPDLPGAEERRQEAAYFVRTVEIH